MSVIGAGILCGICSEILISEKSNHKLMGLISGAVMLLAVIKPFANIDISSIATELNATKTDSINIIESAKEENKEELRRVIKDESEAYILQEAKKLHLDIGVEVTVSEDNPPLPVSVNIIGRASNYAGNTLKDYIEDNLNIPRENQFWNS